MPLLTGNPWMSRPSHSPVSKPKHSSIFAFLSNPPGSTECTTSSASPQPSSAALLLPACQPAPLLSKAWTASCLLTTTDHLGNHFLPTSPTAKLPSQAPHWPLASWPAAPPTQPWAPTRHTWLATTLPPCPPLSISSPQSEIPRLSSSQGTVPCPQRHGQCSSTCVAVASHHCDSTCWTGPMALWAAHLSLLRWYLSTSQPPSGDNWSNLIEHSGSGAIRNVKNHFQEVFSNTPMPTRTADCSHHIGALQAHMDQTEPTPLQPEELSLALANLKLGKTSGASGMSNEFLLANGKNRHRTQHASQLVDCNAHRWWHPASPSHRHCVLAAKDSGCHRCIPDSSHPSPWSFTEAFREHFDETYPSPLAIPPCPSWGGPRRPTYWGSVRRPPHDCLGQCHGQDPSFPQARHQGRVASFLATLPAQVSHEAMRLMQLLLDQTIQFSFLDAHWQTHSSNGTPQGGSHSASFRWAFARTLDHAIGDLLQQWEAQGHVPLFPPLWLLPFVDDILMCADASTPAIAFLCGLSCSTWIAHQSRQKLFGCESGSESFCPATSPARHLAPISMGGTHKLPHQAIQLIHAAWGRLRPVLKRCHWQHPATTCKMLDQYVGNAFLWLSPVLYPHQLFRTKVSRVQTTLMIEALNLYVPVLTDEEAHHHLLRLRRHLVKRWILQMAPSGSWEIQYLRRYWSFLGHICRQEFRSNHPAKVMLHHLIAQHSHKLNRPGPWNTQLEGDYIHVPTDRDVWKSLSESFLHWHGFTRTHNNVEMLARNPWDKTKRLLHIPVAWIHLVFVGLPAGVFTAVWLDTVAGFSVWAQNESEWSTAGIWSQHYKRLPTVMLPFEYAW